MLDIVRKTFAAFDNDLSHVLGENYLDIVVYGSSTLDAFESHRGDLDFVVITRNDLSDTEIDSLFRLHDGYREKKGNYLEYQLEGTYYPEKAMRDIRADFVGCYIGSGRKGWRRITQFSNNVFDVLQFRTNGEFIRKTEIEVYRPMQRDIEDSIRTGYREYKRYLDDEDFPPHVAIQYVARVAFYINHGRIGSKQEACEEYAKKYLNDPYILRSGMIKMQDDYREIEREYPNNREIAKKVLEQLKDIGEIAG